VLLLWRLNSSEISLEVEVFEVRLETLVYELERKVGAYWLVS
jgi:hypothetical protein